jgi:hypothetical protein
MRFLAEQHLAVAKLLRSLGAGVPCREQERWIRKSNSFLVCAKIAAQDRGGISLEGFSWKALTPDWSLVDGQMSQLPLPHVGGPPLAPDL